MDLEARETTMRAVDELAGDLLVCVMFEGEAPPRGVAGLVDWRTEGALSRLIQRGLVTGALADRVLLAGGRSLSFERIVVVGLGPASAFEATACRAALASMTEIVAGLRTRRVALEVPRNAAAIARPASASTSDGASVSATEAAKLLGDALARLDREGHVDTLTVLDAESALPAYFELARHRALERRRAVTGARGL